MCYLFLPGVLCHPVLPSSIRARQHQVCSLGETVKNIENKNSFQWNACTARLFTVSHSIRRRGGGRGRRCLPLVLRGVFTSGPRVCVCHTLPCADIPWADTPRADTSWADTPRQTPPGRHPLPSACWDTYITLWTDRHL